MPEQAVSSKNVKGTAESKSNQNWQKFTDELQNKIVIPQVIII